MQIIKCPKCAVKNRINSSSDNLKPICGRCGACLINLEQEKTPPKSPSRKNKSRIVFAYIFVALTVAVAYGIWITPELIRKDFTSLIAAEAQQTEMLKKQHEDKLAIRKTALEKDLGDINPQNLHQKATQNYKGLLEARKSFDKRYALSPREKTQLRMANLSSDSTKSFHDAIRSVAKEASPPGADISVHESSKGIALRIDFDMSSMTSGEHDTRTKHHTKDSLRKEVVSLVSRVTNDIFQFCKGFNINTVYIGCRHYVTTTYPDGSQKKENMILYKIRIQENQIPQLANDPFLDIYSTTKYFKVDEDNFHDIEIKSSRI